VHQIEPGGEFGDRISRKEGNALFERDIAKLENAVNSGVTAPLSQNQFNALVSFTYNEWVSAFMKSTLREDVNNGHCDDVPFQMRRWKYSGRPRIVNRV
jgi:lysozyme